MQVFCLNIRQRLFADSKINIFDFLFLEKSNADYLVESCLQVQRSLNIWFIIHVLKLFRYSIQRKCGDELCSIGINLVTERSTKQEPSVVELLKLIRIYRIFPWLLAENRIRNTNDFLLWNRRKQAPQKTFWNLKFFIWTEGNIGLLARTLLEIEFLFKQIQPSKII